MFVIYQAFLLLFSDCWALFGLSLSSKSLWAWMKDVNEVYSMYVCMCVYNAALWLNVFLNFLNITFYICSSSIPWSTQILNRLIRDIPFPQFWKLQKTIAQHLICWSIQGFNFIQKTPDLHSPQQLRKNPAVVPAILSVLPCVLFQPWNFSMFTFRLLILVFHANRNGRIRAGKAFTQHNSPLALEQYIPFPTHMHFRNCLRARVCVRRCTLRDFHGGVGCMWVVQCFTTQYNLQETVNHYLL